MNLGMSQRLIQVPAQRLALEQRLEQRLAQQVKQSITLSQYLTQESLIKDMIEWANKNDAWVNFNRLGFNFIYGALPYDVAKPIADTAGLGFAHCLYDDPIESIFLGDKVARARGDWTLFVVKDKIPEDLVDFVALHERGEELSLGDHYFASLLEFSSVAKRKKTKKYTAWIDDVCPSKFIDLTQRALFPILPVELLEELKERRKNEQELAIAQDLIENHPLPSSVLRLMNKYEGSTRRV